VFWDIYLFGVLDWKNRPKKFLFNRLTGLVRFVSGANRTGQVYVWPSGHVALVMSSLDDPQSVLLCCHVQYSLWTHVSNTDKYE